MGMLRCKMLAILQSASRRVLMRAMRLFPSVRLVVFLIAIGVALSRQDTRGSRSRIFSSIRR